MRAWPGRSTHPLSRWINRDSGRIICLCAGCLLVAPGTIEIRTNHPVWGIAALVWSVFPLTAGIFDVCWISAVLGGPLKGVDIRKFQESVRR
jgi:hypothetical protein